MECNKDDAIKAKEVAERKFNAKDMAGAKKFALKAQTLYPGLEGISQMLATLDVYASAGNQMDGEVDWYGVLGVTSQADEDTIRKQYRKLALMLHPDKNKSIGAEGAFKLISEAWSLLSDKNKRASYDAKRNTRVFQQKAKPPSESSKPPATNGFYNFAKTTNTNPKVNKNANANASRANGSSGSDSNKGTSKTFWTVCHRCKMQYEYLRSYLNHNLLCPNCHQPFFAMETPPPVSSGSRSSMHGSSSQQRQKSPTNFQWTPFSGAGGPSSAAQAANVVQQTYEKVKRVREETQAAKKQEKAMKRKNYISENMVGVEKKRRASDDGGVNSDFGLNQTNRISKWNSTRELTQIELCNMLMEKGRKEICKKISEWKSTSVVANAAKREKTNEKTYESEKRKTNAQVNCDMYDFSNSLQSTTLASAPKEILDRLSIPVPDPDFHDFDKYRTETAFEENQIWALYDNDDGMPRYYVKIHNVISQDPFRVKISWLNANLDTELDALTWVGSSFSRTCGDFRIGRHETYDGLNCFSHKVRWTKGRRGVICIFPRKGDVWALYRNWSSNWNELTADEVIYKYDMVEVLEDYDEELGVVVIPLVKVAGFKALFHQHLDPKKVRRIPKEEIFRFSHQVPSHLLSGQEAPNAPKGCRELDPAALPLEFLQVISDVKEKDIMENLPTQQGEISDNGEKKSMDRDITLQNAEGTREEVTTNSKEP